MKQPNEMTNQELNEALAIEGMGWHIEKVAESYPGYWCEPNYTEGLIWHIGKSVMRDDRWNPTEDLNQVRMLEENIFDYEMLYLDNLDDVLAVEFGKESMKRHAGRFYAVHATARQKCEALLMTFREVSGE